MRFVSALRTCARASAVLSAALLLAPHAAHSHKTARAGSAAIASADTFASAAGLEILRRGGNAVDAAIATAFALAVTYPRAGNIGGGGFMLVRLASGEAIFIDYREKAPIAAHRDMFLDDTGDVIEDASAIGHASCGVPGTVAGLSLAHRLYGTLPWRELVEPARRLAGDGFPVSRAFIKSLQEERELLESFEPSKAVFLRTEWKHGDLFVQKDLARTLARIRDEGADDFYRGETASLIIDEMSRGGGLISAEDLRNYQAVIREPLVFRYRDRTVVTAPPPSSGGLILSILLQLIEPLGPGAWGFHSAQAVHMMSEAEKIAYFLRSRYMGDGDFYPTPWKELTAPAYVGALRRLMDPHTVLPAGTLGTLDLDPLSFAGAPGGGDSRGRAPYGGRQEPEETTHFSIVDAWGNAVANTYTLNTSFGSGVTVAGAGFLLNNEMDDFSIKPGFPNEYGLVGGEANAIEPGKRMLSSMTPAMVLENDSLFMVLGTPGGSRIPTAVFQVIVNVLDYGMSLEEAVRAPRFHEQYLPDSIYVEADALAPSVAGELEAMGHKIRVRKPMCDVHAIMVSADSLTAVSDPRWSGCAAGY
ncbi:MAG: gamma-glutamyltransferase [Chitinivibrionia bacterium]|nr:gamma-glutamyltransferase [Chitinivibrionia bacterium]